MDKIREFTMSRIMLFLLPAILPLLLYVVSFIYSNRKALKYGNKQPNFFSKELYKAFIIGMVIALIFFSIFIFTNFYSQKEGLYIPAKIVNGELVKGRNN